MYFFVYVNRYAMVSISRKPAISKIFMIVSFADIPYSCSFHVRSCYFFIIAVKADRIIRFNICLFRSLINPEQAKSHRWRYFPPMALCIMTRQISCLPILFLRDLLKIYTGCHRSIRSKAAQYLCRTEHRLLPCMLQSPRVSADPGSAAGQGAILRWKMLLPALQPLPEVPHPHSAGKH